MPTARRALQLTGLSCIHSGVAVVRAGRVCSTHGCPTVVAGGGRCDECAAAAEAKRGTAAQRGYTGPRHSAFRARVLARDPLCVCADTSHGHAAPCLAPSRHADHWPVDRRTLVRRGLNPNDPQYGRGLCHPCHSASTAVEQPGGWNTR